MDYAAQSCLTTLTLTACKRTPLQVCPYRPTSGREKKQNHRIESLDYFKASSLPYKGSERILRLLNEASFALTEHLSM